MAPEIITKNGHNTTSDWWSFVKYTSKLLIAQKYKDNREAVLLLLLDMSKILKLTIESNPQIETIGKIDSILETYGHIEANSNIRLALAKMIF